MNGLQTSTNLRTKKLLTWIGAILLTLFAWYEFNAGILSRILGSPMESSDVGALIIDAVVVLLSVIGAVYCWRWIFRNTGWKVPTVVLVVLMVLVSLGSVLTVAVRTNIAPAQFYLLQGKYEAQQENWVEAINFFDRALEKKPKWSEAILCRGQVHRNLGKYTDALADFERVIEADTENAKAYALRANTYLALQDYERALDDANKAIELDPALSFGYMARATVRSETGDKDKAMEDLERAIELSDNPALIQKLRSMKALLELKSSGVNEQDIDFPKPKTRKEPKKEDISPKQSIEQKLSEDKLYKKTKIVFDSHRDGNWEIYVMNADGTEQKNLTNNPAYDDYPSWSHDGKKIAFHSIRKGNREIYVMNADGTEQKRLKNNPAYRQEFLEKFKKYGGPSRSPDGKKITFHSRRTGNTEIYVMNADGSRQKRLTNNPSNDWNPSWSPDGKKIVFMSNRDIDNFNWEIYIMNADGSEQENLTNNPAWDMNPSWSPFLGSENKEELQLPRRATAEDEKKPTEALFEAAANEPEPKVDYVTRINELAKAGREERLNAAPFYQKAIELCVKGSEEQTNLARTSWPTALSVDQQKLLRRWVHSNFEALSQLELGTKKPYYWVQYSSPDGTMTGVLVPGLDQIRHLVFALSARAKLDAAEGNIDKAMHDIVTCYRFGLHMSGSLTSVEQLVGVAIRGGSIRTAFEVLDRTKMSKALMKSLQSQIEQLFTDETYICDLRLEMFFQLDVIQRIYTDDGKGDGQLHVPSAKEFVRGLSDSILHLTDSDVHILEKFSRRQTTEIMEKVYEYFDSMVRKSPWQWKKKKTDFDKQLETISKGNPLVLISSPEVKIAAQVFSRCKVDTDALITTLALLLYEADRGALPEKLDELVSAGYLKKLPMDPYSDAPLVYRRLDNDFTLYSLGEDFYDDAGARSKWGTGEQGGDQVFWPVRLPQKAEKEEPVKEDTVPKKSVSLEDKLYKQTRIAFDSDRDGNYEIYVMNADGTEQENLTNNPAIDYAPSWSPDGKKIAFESDRDGNVEIYVMNADGSEQKRLTNNPAADGDPSWSPDGKKIAFDSKRDGNYEIYVMNSDGSQQKNLTNNPAHDYVASWSPDGKKIAFDSERDGKRQIYIMNVDGTGQRNLINNPAWDWYPSWSPGGEKIAFHRGGYYAEIYVMNADGSEQKRLTNNRAGDWQSSWSPDGKKIAFESRRDGNDEIYLMNVDGSDQRNLTNNPARDSSPSWSPFLPSENKN